MVVLLIGMVFGTKLGAMTIMLYYVEGAMGIPVFAGTPEKGIGLAYMLGPTGGYLAGFLLAAMACGELARRGWDRATMACRDGHGHWQHSLFTFADYFGLVRWVVGTNRF